MCVLRRYASFLRSQLGRGAAASPNATRAAARWPSPNRVAPVGLEPTPERGLDPPPLPFGPERHSRAVCGHLRGDGGIRTLTERVLNAIPLPIGVRLRARALLSSPTRPVGRESGERGIRTPGVVSPAAFKAAAISLSASSPLRRAGGSNTCGVEPGLPLPTGHLASRSARHRDCATLGKLGLIPSPDSRKTEGLNLRRVAPGLGFRNRHIATLSAFHVPARALPKARAPKQLASRPAQTRYCTARRSVRVQPHLARLTKARRPGRAS